MGIIKIKIKLPPEYYDTRLKFDKLRHVLPWPLFLDLPCVILKLLWHQHFLLLCFRIISSLEMCIFMERIIWWETNLFYGAVDNCTTYLGAVLSPHST